MATTKRSQLGLADSMAPAPKRVKIEEAQVGKQEASQVPEVPTAMSNVTLRRLLTSLAMIKHLIDPSMKTYFVHAHLLFRESDEHYASAHQGDGFTVITDDKITAEETPLFSYVIEWLYIKENEAPSINDLSVANYTRLWTLADKIRMPRLNNHIMRILISRRKADRAGLFKEIYETVILKKVVFETMEREMQCHRFVIEMCVWNPKFCRAFNIEDKKEEKYGKGFMEDPVSEYGGLVMLPEEDPTKRAFTLMDIYDEDGELLEEW